MTKTETHFTFRRCNLCDSPRITWQDKEDNNHLCKGCKDNITEEHIE